MDNCKIQVCTSTDQCLNHGGDHPERKAKKPEASCGYVPAYSEAVSMLSSITEAWSVLGLPIRLNSDSFSLETEAQPDTGKSLLQVQTVQSLMSKFKL